MGIILPSQLGPCKKRFWEFCAHTNSDSVMLPQKTELNIKGQDKLHGFKAQAGLWDVLICGWIPSHEGFPCSSGLVLSTRLTSDGGIPTLHELLLCPFPHPPYKLPAKPPCSTEITGKEDPQWLLPDFCLWERCFLLSYKNIVFSNSTSQKVKCFQFLSFVAIFGGYSSKWCSPGLSIAASFV